MRLLPLLVAPLILLSPMHGFAAAPIRIVAAENFYGDVAGQIGGPEVTVTSILSNPDQDPHLFEVTPSVARAISAARIVAYNGLLYDPWMTRLLRATERSGRTVIDVGALTHHKPGDNPHIWYDTTVMLRFGEALADQLARIDPTHAADYRRRLDAFRQSIQPIQTRIAALHARLAGVAVTATEPVFGYMLDALGMQVRNMGFQRAVMNNTEPSAADVAAFEADLRQHRVRLLVYNSQATGPIAMRMMRLAKASQVPILGVTETEPKGITYQAWMLNELTAFNRALAK